MQKESIDFQKIILANPNSSVVEVELEEVVDWVDPDQESGYAQAATRIMIRKYGKGPFVLKRIQRVPFLNNLLLTVVGRNGIEFVLTEKYFVAYKIPMNPVITGKGVHYVIARDSVKRK